MALARALRRMELHGPITNRDLLVRTLLHPDFLAGNIDTGFYVRHDPAELGASLVPSSQRGYYALAAALVGQVQRREAAPVLGSIPSGWRNSPSQPQESSFHSDGDEITVGYRFTRTGIDATVDGENVDGIQVLAQSGDAVVLLVAGVRTRYSVHWAGKTAYVDGPEGGIALVEQARFPSPVSEEVAGSLVAPMPGKVITVNVTDGDRVAQGDVLVVIEAMKMEHTVRSPAGGVVESVRVSADQQVENGEVLVVVTADVPADA